MQQLVFATNNHHKLGEVAAKAGDKFKLLSLGDIGCREDIAETGNTFKENASIKSHFVFDRYHLNCFADDSGLEVDALRGEPGVYSARYSGMHGDSIANMDKLLLNLGDNPNRKARFRTVISLLLNGREFFFEGVIEGLIRHEPCGTAGFGYDPFSPMAIWSLLPK
jgi:XTP/dITP diphosphohydrolase